MENRQVSALLCIVITDHFTKYAQAYPTKYQTTKTVASTLWENFISQYGFPMSIHSDQTSKFKSELIADQYEISRVMSLTTPYHLMGNPVK